MNNIEKHSLSERHYPALDGLRGVAALMIVWRHFLQLVPMHGRVLSSLSVITGFSWVGVDLFFVLSGFLITGILADAKFKKHYFRTFYGRRILRIFPLYYAVVAIVLMILPQLGVQTGVHPSAGIYFWTYTSNFYLPFAGWDANYLSHLWTLAIEEQFYLVWPLVIYFATSLEGFRRGLLWAFVSVSVLRCILYFSGLTFGTLYLSTETHCEGLILGGYLALSLRSKAPDALRGLRPNKWFVTCLLLAAILILNESGLFPGLENIPVLSEVCGVITLPVWAILFVWLIYAATLPASGKIYTLFSNRKVRWFGKYSYALYILHVPLANLILHSEWAWLSSIPIVAEVELCIMYFGTCILVAFLSWHLYEKHFLKLKRYLQDV
jgi:peptidoglycan/LPS O-acetylase OafA/YrhL